MYEKEKEEEFLYPHALATLFEKAIKIKPLSSELPPLPKIKKVERDEIGKDTSISGVDGSHKGKELTGHYFGIVTAISYTGYPRRIVDPKPICKCDIFRFASVRGSTWLSLMDTKFIFDVALMTAKEKSPDYILIDGPLLMHPVYFSTLKLREKGIDIDRDIGYESDLSDCIKSIVSCLEHCFLRNMRIIGVVKRSRSTLLDPDKRKRDSAILDRVMEYGEMTESLSPGKHQALDHYASMESKHLRDPRSPGFIRVVYLKSSKIKAPIRLEIPYWVEDDDEIANLILAISDPVTGIPAHIIKSENLIRVGEMTLRSVYLRILSRELSHNRLAESDLKPIYGEEFIREEE